MIGSVGVVFIQALKKDNEALPLLARSHIYDGYVHTSYTLLLHSAVLVE